MSSIASIGSAARSGQLDAAIAVLLDELEAYGGIVTAAQREQLGARLSHIAGVRKTIWAQQPELAAADLYARTHDLPMLDAVRSRWCAELDARGPWLRALRPIDTPAGLVAELRDELGWSNMVSGLAAFAHDEQLVLDLPRRDDERQRYAWSWTQGRVEPRPQLPAILRRPEDPRFERVDREPAPVRRAGPLGPRRQLEWPEFGHAHAHLSADERRILVYGWHDEDSRGLVRSLDARSLRVERELEFSHGVSTVIEGRDHDELLISTHREVVIMRGEQRHWCLEAPGNVAWSPSRRFVAVVDSGVVQIWDTHVDPQFSAPRAGLPLAFGRDGARLVDGCGLFDGRSGERLATLDVQLGDYLLGGPRKPWFHVGTELIACNHGPLQLWDAHTGAAVETAERRVHSRDHCAYTRCGRQLVRYDHGTRQLVVHELASGRILVQFEHAMVMGLLAISSSAQLIAVLERDGLTVRDPSGQVVHRGQLDIDIFPGRPWEPVGRLQFAGDDRQLVYSRRSSPTNHVWSLAESQLELGTATPTPRADELPGWTIEAGPISTFTRSDGVQVAVAQAGPWRTNPAASTLLACPGGLFELRGS